jgi:hypothetical protein
MSVAMALLYLLAFMPRYMLVITMRSIALLAVSLLACAAAQWPQLCTAPGQFSAWNETRCPAGATCCKQGFSITGMGCCPFANATCCPNGYTCCPGGTQCVQISGTTWDAVYNCTSSSSGAVVGLDDSVCKPGVMQPLSTTLKNVVVIGDSLSIGYTPSLAAALSDVALVQHAPADVSDGGAEETAYGLQCIDYWLHSPSGMELGPAGPDLITFNFGMHDYAANGTGVPGQSGNSSVYALQLALLAGRLIRYTATHPRTKLLFLMTTPYLCDGTIDRSIQGLNAAAAGVMAELGVPTLDPYTAIRQYCGGTPPTPGCEAQPSWGGDCWCPHCPSGYSWLTSSTLAAPIRAMLQRA